MNRDDLRTRYEAAKGWLEDKAFQAWLLDTRKDLFNQMMADGLSAAQVMDLRAEIRALESIAQRLKSYVDGYKQDARQAS